MGEQNETLNRLVNQGKGLLVNPFFERVGGSIKGIGTTFGPADSLFTQPAANGVPLGVAYLPYGWSNFGPGVRGGFLPNSWRASDGTANGLGAFISITTNFLELVPYTGAGFPYTPTYVTKILAGGVSYTVLTIDSPNQVTTTVPVPVGTGIYFSLSAGLDIGISAQAQAKSPFVERLDKNGEFCGIECTAVKGTVSGLIQRIPRGALLRGKRVRIYGAYYTTRKDTNVSEVPLGVSIWLKGRVRTFGVTGSSLSGTLGSTTSGTGTFTTTEAVTNVSVGDTLWVQNEGFFQIATVTPGVPNTITVAFGATFQATAAGTRNWTIGRRTIAATPHNATWMSDRGIRIHEGTRKVGHIVNLSGPDDFLPAGEPWYIPQVDDLAMPNTGGYVSGVSPPTITDATRTGAILAFNASRDNGGALGNYWGPGALPPSTGSPSASLQFIDSDGWANNPAFGNVSVFDQFHASDGQVHYFETIYEIPSNLECDTEDLWIILLPTEPTAGFNSLQSDVGVAYLACQMELLPKASTGGSGIEDRLFSDFMTKPEKSLPMFRRASEVDAVRDPFWAIRHTGTHMLDAVPALGTNYPTRFIRGTPGSGLVYLTVEVAAGTPGVFYIPLPRLPTGATVCSAQIGMDSALSTTPPGGVVSLQLWEQFFFNANVPGAIPTSPWLDSDHWIPRSAVGTFDGTSDTPSFSLTPTGAMAQLYRNRVGMPWPQGVANTDPISIQGNFERLRPSQWWLRVTCTGAGAWVVPFLGMHVIYIVDPRIESGMYWSKQ